MLLLVAATCREEAGDEASDMGHTSSHPHRASSTLVRYGHLFPPGPCLVGTRCRADDPRAYRRRSLPVSGFADAKLIAVVEGKTEWVAEGG
jgi:hypothetical protein